MKEIKCTVIDCKYNDTDIKSCTKKEIKVCPCETKCCDCKELTMCDSYKER